MRLCPVWDGRAFTMPLSMVADTIDVDELATGERKEGLYYGCMTLCYKRPNRQPFSYWEFFWI